MAKDCGWCKPNIARRLTRVRRPTSVLRLPPQKPGQGGAPTLDAACPGPASLPEDLENSRISCVGWDHAATEGRLGPPRRVNSVPPSGKRHCCEFGSQRLRAGLTSVTPTAFCTLDTSARLKAAATKSREGTRDGVGRRTSPV